MALLVYAWRNLIRADRPLSHAVVEIQKRLDAERARGDDLDRTIDQLREELRDARDKAATSLHIQEALTTQLGAAQHRVSELVDETVGYRREIDTLREEARRLREDTWQ